MSKSTINNNNNNNPSLKILMLHGYTQSGPIFYSKTRALQKALIRAFPSHNVYFSFPTGPQRLLPPSNPVPIGLSETSSSYSSSIGLSGASPHTPNEVNENDEQDGNFGWWIRPNDDSVTHYSGLDTTFQFIAGIMRGEGPFDGVVGFSQGAALAGLLASALQTDRVFPEADMGFSSPFEDEDEERDQDQDHQMSDKNSKKKKRRHPPLKFAVIYSGLRVMDIRCQTFYEPVGGDGGGDSGSGGGAITQTRILHIIGGVDSVLDERRSRALVDCCGEGGKEIVVHPGGHFVPSQRPWLDAVVGFIIKVVEEDEIGRGIKGAKRVEGVEEEGVEDMKVPF